MKSFLKKYLFIVIFTVVLSVAGIVSAENTVNNTTENNTTTQTKNTNNTTNTTQAKTTTTKKTTTKSSNANLSTLGVTPKEYDFTGFKQDTTSYSVTVPNSVDSLKVAYKTADSKAKVKVTGNTDLEVGTNTIKVVVTAEDGKTTKTYTIKVTKLATEDSKPGNLIDENSNSNAEVFLSSLSISGLELSPEFSKDVFSYEATIDMDENDMSEVKVEAKSDDKSATIEVTGNKGLQEGENIINIIVKSPNATEQTVYQITVNKISKASEIASSGFHFNKEHAIIGSFIAVVIIIFVIIFINHRKNKEYDYEEENEEENPYDFKDENKSNDNFIEDLYKRKNSDEKLYNYDKETMEDIENETDRIFNKPKKGEMAEFDDEENIERRRKGKHF